MTWGVSHFLCHYPDSHQGLVDTVDAANSLWKERHRWQTHEAKEWDCGGFIECLA